MICMTAWRCVRCRVPLVQNVRVSSVITTYIRWRRQWAFNETSSAGRPAVVGATYMLDVCFLCCNSRNTVRSWTSRVLIQTRHYSPFIHFIKPAGPVYMHACLTRSFRFGDEWTATPAIGQSVYIYIVLVPSIEYICFFFQILVRCHSLHSPSRTTAQAISDLFY